MATDKCVTLGDLYKKCSGMQTDNEHYLFKMQRLPSGMTILTFNGERTVHGSLAEAFNHLAARV